MTRRNRRSAENRDTAALRYRVETLEPRVLLAADWAAGFAPSWTPDAEAHTPDGELAELLTSPPEPVVGPLDLSELPGALDLDALSGLRTSQDADSDSTLPDPIADPTGTARTELVVFDARVEGYEQLLSDLQSGRDDFRHIEILVLDGQRDGIEQISDALTRYRNLDAVHLISHGTENAVQLGDAWLDSRTLASYRDAIAAWSGALADDADLLIYGCNLAAGGEGVALLEGLASLTGADVAGSDDLTGSALLGGDWELEYRAGLVEAALAFSAEAQQDWAGVLAITEDDFSSGDYSGGTGSWTGNWSETDDGGGGSGGGLLRIVGGELLITPDKPGDEIHRQVDLSGATSATLTFDFDNQLIGAADEVRVEVSGDGGGSWSPLETYDNGNTGTGSESFGITSDIAANTQIRFYVVSDGDANPIYFDNIQIDTGANTAPVLNGSIPSGETNYVEGAGPMVIDPGMAVDDVDSLDFAGGVLTMQFAIGNDAGDLLAVRDEGTGSGQVSVSGTTVRYNFGAGAVDIGTATGGTDGTGPLLVSFNASATEEAVRAVTRNVTYHNVSAVPSEADRTVQFTLTDGDGGTSNTETVKVHFEANHVFWFSSKGSESPSDALGGAEDWLSGDVVEFGDGASFEPTGPGPTTSGAFANQFSFTGVNQISLLPEQVDLRALHYVGIPTVLGSGGDTFTVQPGDVIGAIDNADTIRLTSSDASTIDVTRKDVFVFRPDTPGSYGAGTFTLLLSNPFGNNIHAITLIEEQASLGSGGANSLDPGDFLVSYSGLGDHDDVYKFTASKVVTATDVGTPTKMLEGSALGFTDQVQGLDMIEKDVTVGDTTIAQKQLLMSLDQANTVGGTLLSVTPHDVFVLDVIDTELTGGTAATATLVFDGSDVSLGDGDATEQSNETLDGLTLARLGTATSNAAPTLSVPPIAFINEFHYDNVGVDTGEFVEIAALSGTDLAGWNLVFYNGANGMEYRTTALSGVVLDLGAGMGTLTFNLPVNGIQNGDSAADGIALVDAGGTVLEFISYEGTLTAADGPAVGMNSTDTGVAEDGTTPVGHSLQLTGAGATFPWATAAAETPGAANTGQDFTAAGGALTEQVLEGGALVFSTGNGNALTVADPDAGTVGDPLRMTLTAAQGTLTLAGTAGLTSVAGDGMSSVSFEGTAAEINAALDGLSYKPATDYAGSDLLTIVADDQGNTGVGGALTDTGQVQITVTPVNDEPSFTTLGDQNVDEDSGPHTVAGFATPAPGGGTDEAGQTFTYTVSNDNPGLFAVGPVIDASGQLTYTLNPNVNGSATVTVSVTDSGGTANGGDDTSPNQTFDIVVAPVNDEPSFNTLGDQNVDEDSGPHTVAGFATPAPGGGTDEAGQTFTYTVSNDNPGLFAVGPVIDASGQLTYTLNPNVNGSATVTVSVTDSGGTANGGDDTSPNQTFDIVVAPVNDEPSFNTLGDQNVDEDSGPHTVAGFATPAAGGGADEAGQTFSYTVSNDNPGLFAVGPAIDASGQLTYTLNPNVNGSATVTVSVTDSGGTANGGDDISPSQTFDIVVASVNDEPSLNLLGNQNVDEDSGPHTVVGFATSSPGGGADEAGQTFSYAVSNNNAGLFAVGPAIDASGTLTYTLNANVSGSATVTVSVTDTGGTANGGDDTSPNQTFDIVVAPVNDEPSLNLLGNQNVDEDSGPHTVVGFATSSPGGGTDEAGQTFSYTVSNDNPGLFAVGPAIDASGQLTYTLNPNVNGTATVTVSVTDSGGTANGGDDISPSQTFDIVVASVNDEPSLNLLGNQNVDEDSGPHTVVGFATSSPGGGADEAGQTFSYAVSNNNAGLFAVGPAIDASGTLTYTLNANVSGSATVTVSVTDSGGTANGGDDTSPAQNFSITVNPVNDSPSGTDMTVTTLEDTAYVFPMADFGFSDPADGDALLAVEITTLPGAGTLTNNSLILAAGDTVSAADIAADRLVFTPATGASGTAYASFNFRVQDTGGTAAGGVDLDPTANRLTIDVADAPDPPVPPPVLPPPDIGPDPDPPGPDEPPLEATSPDPEPAEPNPPVEISPLSSTGGGSGSLSSTDRLPVELDSNAAIAEPPQLVVAYTRSEGNASAPDVPVPATPGAEPGPSPGEPETADGDPTKLVATRADITLGLDRMRNALDEEIGTLRLELGQTTGAAVGLSVGYVSWLLRGGVLLSSVLSSLPAWSFIDPLPVFSSTRRRAEDDDDESLETIVEGGAAPDSSKVDGADDGRMEQATSVPTSPASKP